MKKIIGIALALALALAMGIAAFAEMTPAEPAVEPAPAVTEETSATEAEASSQDDLNAAMDAYRAARQAKKLADLEEELNGYVEAGSLTREQADLILKNAQDRNAARNGQCPGCGYQFSQNMDGRKNGARMGGQKGMRGQNGMRGQMNGQRGRGMGNIQQPDVQQPDAQQPDAQQPEAPQVPQM